MPDVLDFPRDVQPILDRHCLPCHDCDKREGGVVLSGDRGPHYSLSYFTLTARSQVADGRNRAQSNYPPRTLGSGGSRLMAMLEPSHYDVKLSPLERKTVRLWIEIGAPYPGTYAALGSGMIGGYDQNTLDRSAETWPSTKAAREAIRRRCGSCHAGATALPLSVCDEIVAPPWDDMSPKDPSAAVLAALALRPDAPRRNRSSCCASLAKEAGGLAICRTTERNTTSTAAAFKSTADPDYVKIRTAITGAKSKLDEIKRFDMPGFRPRSEWVREMKRFGILPAEFSDHDSVDVYAVERRYWESLWPKPDGAEHGQ